MKKMIHATWHGEGVDYRRLLSGMLSHYPTHRPAFDVALTELNLACERFHARQV